MSNAPADINVAWAPILPPSISTVPFCTNPAVLIVEAPRIVMSASLVSVPVPVHVEACHVTEPSVRFDGPSTVSVLPLAENVASDESSVNALSASTRWMLTSSVTV